MIIVPYLLRPNQSLTSIKFWLGFHLARR